MNEMTRRDFGKGVWGTLLTVSLLETLYAKRAFGKAVEPIATKWIGELNTYTQDVKSHKLPQVLWQQKTEELFQHVPLEDLLALIDFENLTRNMELPEAGPKQVEVGFPRMAEIPENVAFTKKIFCLKKDRAIMPHSHVNMCTMHMIINGEFHLRHYNKVESQDEYLLVQPTIDRVAKVGSNSTISDHRNNIHWFQALTDKAFTFDVVVDNIDPKRGFPGKLEFLDAAAAEPEGDLLRMKILDYQDAVQKYGKDMHH